MAGRSEMKVMLTGYSGYAQIDGHDLLMTSFSLSMNENIIPSGGIGKVFSYSNEQFSRYRLNAVRDYPSYEITIGADATFEILDYVFSKITRKFHSFVHVKFVDNASKILYDFDSCCMTAVSLSVSNNDSAKVTLSFVTYKDEIDVEFCENSYDRYAKRNAPNGFVGAVLMPYWAWGVQTHDIYGKYINDDDVYEFSVSYTQQINPKFGCYGEGRSNAPAPKKLVFCLPEVKYEITYLVADSAKITDYLIASNEVAISRRSIDVKYRQTVPELSVLNQYGDKEIEFGFRMTDCYPDSYSPQYWNKDSSNMITVAGTVYGRIEYHPANAGRN